MHVVNSNQSRDLAGPISSKGERVAARYDKNTETRNIRYFLGKCFIYLD